jgi:site-specific recombinase XerD
MVKSFSAVFYPFPFRPLHWMLHTHATHALANGVELTMVRDTLRHASVSTTSTYMHTDQQKRAKQFGAAFAAVKAP